MLVNISLYLHFSQAMLRLTYGATKLLASIGVFSPTCAWKQYGRGQLLPEEKDPQEIWMNLRHSSRVPRWYYKLIEEFALPRSA